jgi:hypothetical protein
VCILFLEIFKKKKKKKRKKEKEKKRRRQKYSNLVIFISSFFCLMLLECPICAHVSSMDLIPSVLESFQYA